VRLGQPAFRPVLAVIVHGTPDGSTADGMIRALPRLAAPGRLRLSHLVRSNIRITTAGAFSDDPLRCALGEDSVMYSVDYPFESMTEAAGWLDAAKLDPHVRAKIGHQNAQALLKLHQPAA
jgi:predicted TIM-barrel fold metal-dependent hydrolase